MAYTPYEWTVNSYLNPTRMNAIEQGIAAASQAAESALGEFHTIEELIGTQSIAGIGDGTLTGATWKINNDLSDLKNTVTTLNSNFNSYYKGKYVGIETLPIYKTWGAYRIPIHLKNAESKTVVIDTLLKYTGDNAYTSCKNDFEVVRQEDTLYIQTTNSAYKGATIEYYVVVS